MKMPFEWDVRVSSKGLHGDRAHVYDETGHRELHHVKGHYGGAVLVVERLLSDARQRGVCKE